MGIWEQFPFTNFHQENLDWAYSALKNLDKRVDTLEQGGGGATKDYVDTQDEKLSAEISRVEKECDTNTTNISRDLNTETQNRTAADDLIEGEIQSISSTVTAINDTVGDWTQQGTISNAIAGVQATAGTSATAIHGTGGTYDMSKGTIQARLNDLENSGGGGLEVTKKAVDYAECFVATSKGTLSVPAGTNTTSTTFSFPRYSNLHSAAPAKPLYAIIVTPTNGAPVEFSFSPSSLSYSSSMLQVSGSLISYSSHSSSLTFEDSTYTAFLLVRASDTVVTDVSGGGGASSDVTKSYVDSQDAALDAKITTAQTTADSAVTMASEAQDSASVAVATANGANANATSAKSSADDAKTAADGAVESAQTANANATTALTAIGSKSSAVTFSNLWAAIGAWNESATITARLKDAYNWSWNNRSAINGTADYPTDKGTINARLTELEENGGGSSSVKIASGTGEVGARTGEDLEISFADAGFTETPAVVASYCKTGDNDTEISGIVKVHHVTTTGATISITGGAVGHMYNVSWIATGK